VDQQHALDNFLRAQCHHRRWRQNIVSEGEAGRLAILKYVTHVAVSERTFVCATVRNSASNKKLVVTMTFIMPFRSSALPSAAAAAATRLLRSRIVSSKRLFSSDETTGAASPLVLWLESDQPADNSVILPPRRRPEF
jgi:hypothetical protein